MKIFIIVLIFAAFFISCKKTVLNPQDYARILGNIDNITIDEGISVYTVDLDETFKVENEPGRVITHTLESNSNSTLAATEINGLQLVLKVNLGQTGSSTIKLRSKTDQVYKITEFDLVVNAITSVVSMERAETYFKSADYDLALSHFALVVQKKDSALLSDAYMGMGYSLMRLNDESNDYGYGSFELSLSYNKGNNNARAGLSLLEYVRKQNFNEAIRQGQITLENNPDFVFKYDSSLDKNDILLNIALSQYSALLYDNCLETVKKLDPAYDLEASDTEFEVKLLQKLEELISLYS